jgi:dolichol-phosphate mannosyltransferase
VTPLQVINGACGRMPERYGPEVIEVAVVMPAYNEASGIGEFLEEISAAFQPLDHRIFVQDDCSTDETVARVRQVAQTGVPVEVLETDHNRGHGAATLAVLARGASTGAAHVVAVDGDGEFHGHDIARLLEQCRDQDLDVVEGVRSGRREPVYRWLVTAGTRLLVWGRCRRLPRDANTPLRVYRTSALLRLLEHVPPTTPTPNLHISAITRSTRLRYAEPRVEWLHRRGRATQGSSGFGVRVPSTRFLRFSAHALRQWLSRSAPHDAVPLRESEDVPGTG